MELNSWRCHRYRTITTNPSTLQSFTLLPIILLLFLISHQFVDCLEENCKEKFRLNFTRKLEENLPRIKRTVAQKLLPEFAQPIGNVSAVVGRDVRLVCTVDNLGSYQVAWLKEESRTILSIDTNIIITNYRIFLIPDEAQRHWVLHIKDVRESDRGAYQCQVNTNPMRSTSGYLEVVVPPEIIERETSQMAEVMENSNVSLQCKANGHPRPTISWRREDGEPIKLIGNHEDHPSPEVVIGHNQSHSPPPPHFNDMRAEKLSLERVDRTMAGLYVCTAANGIPAQVSRQIPLYVKFAPKVTIVQKSPVLSQLDTPLELDCLVEAFPKPTSYWSSGRTLDQHHRGAISRRRDQVLSRNRGLLHLKPPVGATIATERHHHNPRRRRHRHHLTQTQSQVLDETSDEMTMTIAQQQPGNHTTIGQPAWVTVKQTAKNAYTYQLKMSIARLRAGDLGEFVCVASNSLGSSSARVTVLEKTPLELPIGTGNAGISTDPTQVPEDAAHYQRDSLISDTTASLWTSSAKFRLNEGIGNVRDDVTPAQSKPTYQRQTNRVYDENYLQAIRNRQSANQLSSASGATGSKLQNLRSSGDLVQRSCGSTHQNQLALLVLVAHFGLVLRWILSTTTGSWRVCK